MDSIKKIHFKAYNTKGVAQGKGVISDGARNEIKITTASSVINRKFVIESKLKRELIKEFCLKMKEKNVSVFIDGIDLK